MLNELMLETYEGKIKLVVCDNGWCKMHWISNKEDLLLGADSVEIIISKLLTFLSEKLETERKYFVYKEMKLFTILNLMGPLATIAGMEVDNYGIKLIFLDYKGDVTQLGVLSIEDKKVWIKKLTEYALNNNNINLSV